MSGRGRGGGRFAGGGRATNPLHTGGRGGGRGYGRGRGRGGPGGGGGRFGASNDEYRKSREDAEAEAAALEERLGFELYADGEPRLGFLMNMSPVRRGARQGRRARAALRGVPGAKTGARCKAHASLRRAARAGLGGGPRDGAVAVVRQLLLHVPSAPRCAARPLPPNALAPRPPR